MSVHQSKWLAAGTENTALGHNYISYQCMNQKLGSIFLSVKYIQYELLNLTTVCQFDHTSSLADCLAVGVDWWHYSDVEDSAHTLAYIGETKRGKLAMKREMYLDAFDEHM